MATNDAKNWEQARAQLVKQRRTIIEALAKGYTKGRTENHIDLLVKIQAGIDALDKTKDEVFRSSAVQERSKPERYVPDDLDAQ